MIAVALAALALATPFDYDASQPLEVRVVRTFSYDGAAVRDISFASGDARVSAYLVVPERAGPRPAAVVQPGGFAGRDGGLGDAVDVARRGIVALTIDGPEARGARRAFACSTTDADEFRRYVVDLRRGLDLLQSLPEVDGSRLGYAGFSFGAETGALLAGVDSRVRAAVLQSGGGYLSTVYRAACKGLVPRARLASATAAFAKLDPARWIRGAAAAFLFQNGRLDRTYPRREVLALHRAAPAPKTVRWYAADHQLTAAAYALRSSWLAQRLAAG